MMMKAAGFTLIQLIVAIAVIGIVSAIFVSKTVYMPQLEAQFAARAIASDIRYAQSFAISTQQRTRVSFSPSTESYSIYYEQAPGSDIWTLMKDPDAAEDFTVVFAGDYFGGIGINHTSFDGFDRDLVFDKRGMPWSYNRSSGAEALLASEGEIWLGNHPVVGMPRAIRVVVVRLHVVPGTGRVYMGIGPRIIPIPVFPTRLN
jgi:type II secretory pathway pseudopilin PulG